MRNLTYLSLWLLLAAPALRTAEHEGSLVPADARMERIAGGFAFTEGPTATPDGRIIFFSDIPNNRILAYDTADDALLLVQDSSGGANGLWFEMGRPGVEARLVVCRGGDRRVTRIDPHSGQQAVLASRWEGKQLNSPNDLAIDAAGGVYFTDPRYGDRSSMEMDIEAVYYITPDGELRRVIDDLERPNGLILSLDERTLYVADNAAQTAWAYDVQRDGALANGRLFARMDEGPHAGGGDGMSIDELGNVYCAGRSHIWVWSPAGELLGRIPVPEGPSNCTFGGPDRRTLYITARTSLYRIRMNVAGGR